MEQKKKAAIDMDAIEKKRLDEISAADFLSALNAGGIALDHLTVWPEKKKVELWREPESYGEINVADIIARIRAEKKKIELEKFPGFETWRDPRNPFYEELLERLTRDIEAKLDIGK
jgi:hypothetical protein